MYMVNHERIAQEMYDEIVICYNVSTVGQYCSCLPKKKKIRKRTTVQRLHFCHSRKQHRKYE